MRMMHGDYHDVASPRVTFSRVAAHSKEDIFATTDKNGNVYMWDFVHNTYVQLVVIIVIT